MSFWSVNRNGPSFLIKKKGLHQERQWQRGIMWKTLIVEDNSTFRQMLKEILHTGFPTMKIAEEPDGSELFAQLDAFHPDIVFIDIRLPGESGLELAKKVKTSHPKIVVVILTSYDLPEYRQAALLSKADHFVTKDSPTQDFLALLDSILPCLKRPE
jgi:DNA-binding NarL/FixJ family response regulator